MTEPLHKADLEGPPSQDMDAPQANETPGGGLICPGMASCCLSSMLPCLFCCSCRTLDPSTHMVILNWGKYWGTIREPGCYVWNPCGISSIAVDIKQITSDLKDVKIGDAKGNPLIVSGVITYKVWNSRKVALEVTDIRGFVNTQGLAVMKQVVSQFPYEPPEGETKRPSLRLSGDVIRTELISHLQQRCHAAGLHIINFELTDLAYAPEIAKSMLVRQQAEALVAARKTIVQGAVSIATEALTSLEQKGVRMDAVQQAHLISNLLVVICGEQSAQPTVSVGS